MIIVGNLPEKEIQEIRVEIIKLRMQGMANKQIADKLDISQAHISWRINQAKENGLIFPEAKIPRLKKIQPKPKTEILYTLEIKTLFDKVIYLRKQGWSPEDIAFHLELTSWTTRKIINKAKQNNHEFPNIMGKWKSKIKNKKLTNPIEIKQQRLLRKITTTEPVTQQLHVTKDFWLFK